MAQFHYRCSEHGDFFVQQEMALTTPSHVCPENGCIHAAPKVFHSPAITFGGGREAFHGQTIRERQQKLIADAQARGLDPVPVSNAELSQQHTTASGRVYHGDNPDNFRNPAARSAAKKALETVGLPPS